MKKVINVLLCILLCVFLAGCSMMENASESNQMPQIVFNYSIEEHDGMVYEYFIDYLGNVYYTNNREYHCHYKDFFEKYNSGKASQECELIKTIDVSILQEKYDLLQEMIRDGNNELVADEDVYAKPFGYDVKWWYGHYYDKEGNIVVESLWGESTSDYTSTDKRAKELVDWMNEVFEVE